MLITATYDGKVFKPKTPLDLDIDQEYQIEVINDVQKKDIDNVLLNKNQSKSLNLAERINLRFAEFDDINIPQITRDKIRNHIDFNE
ncbi:hypothetical protein [Geminocystis herdmanii]|uniref:hypothetical protein n=1 Tax=Geminocystis herdmanii TaxID=669359 RepID=UPI00034BDBE1|nr:hypothetical protein [Geminocystis herdmanii]